MSPKFPLIDRYNAIVKQILSKGKLSQEEKMFIQNISEQLLRGLVFKSNASTKSKLIGYAKQSIIKTLNGYAEGKEILDILSKDNPMIQTDIEVYTAEPIV